MVNPEHVNGLCLFVHVVDDSMRVAGDLTQLNVESVLFVDLSVERRHVSKSLNAGFEPIDPPPCWLGAIAFAQDDIRVFCRIRKCGTLDDNSICQGRI